MLQGHGGTIGEEEEEEEGSQFLCWPPTTREPLWMLELLLSLCTSSESGSYPSLSFFHFHFSLLSTKNLLRQDACAASLCLTRGSNCSSCTTIYLGGRNQFQHLSFEHQTCGLAHSCVFTPSEISFFLFTSAQHGKSCHFWK